MRSKKALGAHDGLRCAGGRLPSGDSLDPLYPFYKTKLTWIKDQGEDCNKVHMNYAKSGKQNPRGEQGVTVKGAQTLFYKITLRLWNHSEKRRRTSGPPGRCTTSPGTP